MLISGLFAIPNNGPIVDLIHLSGLAGLVLDKSTLPDNGARSQ
jgi:hypothetical protein